MPVKPIFFKKIKFIFNRVLFAIKTSSKQNTLRRKISNLLLKPSLRWFIKPRKLVFKLKPVRHALSPTNRSRTIFYKNTQISESIVVHPLRETLFNFKKIAISINRAVKRLVGDGALYLRGLAVIAFIDACLTDDEPLWEPIEWSLVQTWIMFIFIFAWIAENLVTSRFGSFTGRDKRVWFAWYKTFWLVDLSYIVSYGLTALFVIVPFYYELTYNLSFIISWWNWYTKSFFLNL